MLITSLILDGNGTYSTKNPKNTIRVDWKRPNEFCGNPQLFVDGVEEGDVIQGALGDCYFLGALSVVATRKELLEPLVVAAHPEFGFYQFKLFKNGEWHISFIEFKNFSWKVDLIFNFLNYDVSCNYR